MSLLAWCGQMWEVIEGVMGVLFRFRKLFFRSNTPGMSAGKEVREVRSPSGRRRRRNQDTSRETTLRRSGTILRERGRSPVSSLSLRDSSEGKRRGGRPDIVWEMKGIVSYVVRTKE